MSNFLLSSKFLSIVVSISAYLLGDYIRRKTKISWINPLLISCIIVISYLLITKIDYRVYQEDVSFMTYFLTPATVCLAIPLYNQLQTLKKNFKAIIIGSLSGVMATFLFVLAFSIIFKLNHQHFVTLLPKSVTTPVGMVLSEELEGIVSVTVASIIITGIIGNIIATIICKVARINNPIAKGVGIGSASHVIGTTKAMEMGEIEGAMSTLSTVISALLTTVFISFFANLY